MWLFEGKPAKAFRDKIIKIQITLLYMYLLNSSQKQVS